MLAMLIALGFAARAATGGVDSTELRAEALIAALRSGGYTIMLRHTKTDRTINEGPNFATLKRAQQRNLNDDGVRDAKLIGLVMKQHAIPVGEILSSQMYRTRETAEYAFGDPTPRVELQQLAASPEQRALVAAAPAAGTNRVIVTHHFIIERYAPGIQPGDIAEGEAAVVRVGDDGSFTLVGRFKLADWQTLAGPATHGAPGASVVVPLTRAGRIAAGYVEAFNTGTPAAMQAFIEGFMVVDPNRPTAERMAGYRNLYAEHGVLTIVSIQSSVEDTLALSVRSRQGDVSLTVKASAEQVGRGASVTWAFNRGRH
jgi:phosphohistidine phosphatase SixA